MQKHVAAVWGFLLACLFGSLGILLALWVAITLHKVERGFDWALWVAVHSPFSPGAPPIEFANRAIQHTSLAWAAIAAAILCWLANRQWQYARRLLRPVNESHDGKAQIVLKTAQPRVGSPLEGSLRLANGANPGDVFRIEIYCRRKYNEPGDLERMKDSTRYRVETPFGASLDVKAIQDAHGWSVPFRFEIPATAPPSATGNPPPGDGYFWRLASFPANAWVAVPSEFVLVLAGALEEQ